ncbi:MAG: TylF/MycF/NovP-related O-methyltransferase [Pseudomonadota bacterium]
MSWPYQLFQSIPERYPDDPDCQMAVDLANLSLHPPFPWGQILYGKILRERGDQLDGAFAECGVALGGMSLFLAQHAQRLGRHLYAFDSFVGLPAPDPKHDNAYFRKGDYGADRNAGDLQKRFEAEVRQRGLADTVRVVPGFLKDSLGQFKSPDSYAFVHVDLDLYDPVLGALEFFYPRLVDGGVMVIDDFFHHARGPARAAETYFAAQGLSPVYQISFPYSVVVFKGEEAGPGHHRAIDGNRYSFDLLRDLPQLRACVDEACIALQGAPVDLALAKKLKGILQGSGHNSADIYDYWSCLAPYWDDMDVTGAEGRPLIEI